MRMIDSHVPEGKQDRLWRLVKERAEQLLRALLEEMKAYREEWTQVEWHKCERPGVGSVG